MSYAWFPAAFRLGNEPTVNHSIRKTQRVHIHCDVMHSENARTLHSQDDICCGRASIPLVRSASSECSDKTFSRSTYKKRIFERTEFFEARHQIQVFVGRFLGEAKTGIKNNVVLANPGIVCNFERTREENTLIFYRIGKLRTL